MIVDWRLPGEPKPRPRAVVLPNGDDARNPDGTPKTLQVPYAGDSGILIRGSEKAQINITCNTVGSGELYGYRTDRTLPVDVRAAGIPKVKADRPPGQWNRFEITLEGERLMVLLNGQTVIDGARLPRLPARGPIGLQHHGDPVTFKVRTFRTTDGQETWDFGDGTPAVVAHSDGNAVEHARDGYAVTTHRFREPGHYLVRVERADRRGYTATARLQVVVEARRGE